MDQSQFDSSRISETTYVALESELEKPYASSGSVCSMTVSISNLTRDFISVVKIDEILPEEFEVVNSQYPIDGAHALKLNFRIDQGTTRKITLKYKSDNPGSFVWHPALVYIDSSKNYKIARSRAARSVIEPRGSRDFSDLLAQRRKLESDLGELTRVRQLVAADPNELPRIENQLYSVKEQISKIDEEFLRTKNEFVSMQEELERVRADIASLNQTEFDASGAHDRIELELEEKLLTARIERRRLLLEQAQLL